MKVLNAGGDVASKWFDVCILIGDVTEHRRFDNGFAGFAKALRWLNSFSAEKIEFAVEPTGRYGWLLCEFLYGKGVTVLEAQPLLFRRYAESLDMRGKSDYKEAKGLAFYVKERRSKMREWKPKTPLMHELRDMQLLLRSLMKRKCMLDNQLACLLRSDFVKDELERELDSVEERLGLALDRTEFLIRQDEQLAKDMELLDSMPGIAIKTAVMLITFIDFRSFRNGRAVACHLGLTKRKDSSGSTVRGREGMSKRGNKHVRSLLFMPARASVNSDPVSASLYKRLRERGKTDEQAQVAVIRRMVTVAWALVVKQEPFDHKYASTATIAPT